MKYSHRERVEAAINLEEPDRVPIYVNTITVKAYAKLRSYLGLSNVEIKRALLSYDAALHEDFLWALDVDFRGVGLRIPAKRLPGRYVEDWWGVIWKDSGDMVYVAKHPLKDAKTVEDIENYPKWPNPNDPKLIEGVREIAKKLYEETDYAIFCGAAGSIFHRYAHLRGFKQWLLDMRLNPELYKALADKILEIVLEATLNLLNEVADYVVWIYFGDDMGTETEPFMSVKMYREFVKPWFCKLVKTIKKEFPKVKFNYHCHGAVFQLIPEFIDCGIDILNPILPQEKGNDPIKLKKTFGNKICFQGGIDVERIIPFGTLSEVEKHVKEVISILAPGGGYIFGLQHIRENTPPENAIMAYRLALKYGKYPIASTL
ncbi:MAG: hypothetical protein DRN04_12035 [Thermoprotei archaeon]|nr:MAG: hypothetical protein DRN04_12035 [Thermoprotei archaeon]